MISWISQWEENFYMGFNQCPHQNLFAPCPTCWLPVRSPYMICQISDSSRSELRGESCQTLQVTKLIALQSKLLSSSPAGPSNTTVSHTVSIRLLQRISVAVTLGSSLHSPWDTLIIIPRSHSHGPVFLPVLSSPLKHCDCRKNRKHLKNSGNASNC